MSDISAPKSVERFVRNDYGRKVAAEWFAMTAMQPSVKGRTVPFFEFDRIPKSQNELAEMIDVSPNTLSRWHNTDESFKTAVRRIKRKYASENIMKDLSEVDRTLVARARAGDTAAMRIYYDQIAKREGWDSLKWEDLPDGISSSDQLIISIKAIATKLRNAQKDEAIDVQTTDVEVVDVGSDD